LAQGVAEGLGLELPPAMPLVLAKPAKPEVKISSALSLFARPGDGSVKTRRVAILVADGVESESLTQLHTTLAGAGAVPRFVGIRLGRVTATTGDALNVEVSMEAAPPVLWDALVLPDGPDAITALRADGHTFEFIKDQFRHCKPILALGAATTLLDEAGIPPALASGQPDPGVLRFDSTKISAATTAFITAIGKHRAFERQMDPPPV
jgi:catalase